MKILLTGDWQSKTSNLVLSEQSLKKELEIIKRYRIDIHIDLGDSKESYSPVDVGVANFQVKRARKLKKLLGKDNCFRLNGNHDRIGQHSDSRNWLTLFADNAICIDAPTTLKVKDWTFNFLPYNRDVEDLITQAAIIGKRIPQKSLLFFHCDIYGARYSNVQKRKSESKFTVDAMRHSNYVQCFGGHIHKRQTLADNVYYVGNPFPTDQGEVNQEKGFIIYDTNTNKITFISSDLPCIYTFDYLQKKNIKQVTDGTQVKYVVKVNPEDDYYKVLEKAYDEIVKKYPNSIPYVVPDFVEGISKNLEATIDTNCSELDLVTQYLDIVSNDSKERPAVEAYMKHVLSTVLRKSFYSKGLIFSSVEATNILSFRDVKLNYRKKGVCLVRGINKDWPGHSNGCLAEGTLIDVPRNLRKYPNGIPIENLVGKRPWVYSYDRNIGLVLKKANWVKCTGKQVPVIKIQFEETIGRTPGYKHTVPFVDYLILTADHKVMLRNGKWKKAGNLRQGDRLMPLYRKGRSGGYYSLLNNATGEVIYEHRFVLQQLTGKTYSTHTHHGNHINHRRYDNRPSNLEWKSQTKHFSDHAKERNRNGGDFGWQNTTGVHPLGMKGKHHTQVNRNKISATLKKQPQAIKDARNNAIRQSYKIKLQKNYDVLGWSKKVLTKLYHNQGWSVKAIAREYKQTDAIVVKALCFFGIPKRNNHRVKSITKVGYSNVYDINVPDTHNFIANGVVVHNSGKSNLLALLPIAHSGKTFKEQKFGEIVNDYTPDEKAGVTLNCTTYNNDELTIYRQFNPSKLQFTVNGKDASQGMRSSGKKDTQGLIEELTGYTFDTLANAVYIDQSITQSFLYGTEANRANLLHKFQNLDRFYLAQKICSDQYSLMRKLEGDTEASMEMTELLVKETTQRIQELKNIQSKHLDKLRKEWKQAVEELETFDQESKETKLLQSKIHSLEATGKKKQKLVTSLQDNYHAFLGSLNWQKKELHKAKEFLSKNSKCTLCFQDIPHAHKDNIIARLKKKVHSLSSKDQELANVCSKEKIKLARLEAELDGYKLKLSKIEKNKTKLQDEVIYTKHAYQKEKASVSGSSESIKALQKKLLLLKAKYANLDLLREDQLATMIVIGKAITGFGRDGLPLFLNKLLCPRLNAASQYYSKLFTDGEIQVLFLIEGGKLVPRVVNAHGGKKLSGQSLGEKGWAGLITAFSIRDISQPTNLIILDEPGAGLDPTSAKQLGSRLSKLADKFETVLVVTHNPFLEAALAGSNTITVVKHNRTSKIVKS